MASSIEQLLHADSVETSVAVALLYRHRDSSGLQGHICKLLRRCPSWEIEYYLPQLCHLLIAQPDTSVSLQAFLVELCTRSMHSAVCVLWILDAYLEDMHHDRANPCYVLCMQLYQRCRAIVFPDVSRTLGRSRSDVVARQTSPPAPQTPATAQVQADTAASSSSSGDTSPPSSTVAPPGRSESPPSPSTLVHPRPSTSTTRTHVVKGDSRVIAMGLGVIMAAFAMPQLVHALADVIMEHARSIEIIDEGEPKLPDNVPTSSSVSSPVGSINSATPTKIPTRPLTLEELYGGRAFSFNKYIASKKTTFYSKSPSFVRSSSSLSTSPYTNGGGQQVNWNDLSQSLVNPHYFHSEVQFIMTLADIGDRLVGVPKAVRESTLKAELHLLSHNLPARVCIPLWCPATKEHAAHHVVVRIAPDEAVVLNSKARVPYLLHIEVVNASEPLPSMRVPDFDDLSKASDDSKSLFGGESDLSSPSPDRLGMKRSYSRGPLSEMLMPATASSPAVPDPSASSSQANLLSRTSSSGRGYVPSPPVLALSRTSSTPESESDLGTLLPPDVHAKSSLGPSASSSSQDLAAGPASSSTVNHEIQLRTLSVMLAQLSAQESTMGTSADTLQIRSRILKEIKDLQGARLLKKRVLFDNDDQLADIERTEDDPSAHLFLEDFDLKTERIRKSSPWGQHPSWRLLSVIVKCRDDLRQEQLACQIISEFRRAWVVAGLPLFVHPFRVLVTSRTSGLVETIPNATSIHSIKKYAYTTKLAYGGTEYTLKDHFAKEFGPVDSPRYRAAQSRFANSLAGYSLVCYFLNLKDRHDGNILLDREGRLIHIDYGFMLSNSPGSVKFETAPFKMTQEYIDVLGGVDSDAFDAFQVMLQQGFRALRERVDSMALLLEIMHHSSSMPCFIAGGDYVVTAFRERFRLDLRDDELDVFVDGILTDACTNLSTQLYDQYQYYTNGIL